MNDKVKNKKLIEKIDKLGDDVIKSKQNSNLIVDLLKHASVSLFVCLFVYYYISCLNENIYFQSQTLKTSPQNR
jgi:hypothetical protein